ncbi:MAG: hypothetical protein L0Y44_10050 [Phycisphaerales bacterium]|nr:hypothetical protein [Phycisphaerales bacterium]MCI0630978.1 hypothetical protein [Phycisphaerales bacterium]MCI0676778.1 hypothetical protein [Phycisphaerales bacterium]
MKQLFASLKKTPPCLRTKPRRIRVLALAVAGLIVGGSQIEAMAQDRPAPPQIKPKSGALEVVPFTAESIGLSIHLPIGALVSPEKIEGKLVIGVREKETAPTWNMRIQQMAPSKDKLTPAGEIDDLLAELDAMHKPYRLILNQSVDVNGLQGQLCYLEQPNDQGQLYVSGWLVLPHGMNLFLVCSINTLAEHLPRLRPLLDSSFNTIKLRSAEDLTQERESRLAAGRSLLESMTPQRLESLVGLNQWYRIYKPADAAGGKGAERGYSMVEVRSDKKGALNPGRSEADYSADERKTGLLVRIQGRAVINPERDTYYDTIGLYWMAWDQSEEAWSIRGTYRQGENEQTEAETGVRTPENPGIAPLLTVLKADSATNARDPFKCIVPEVYLSQPLGWLIGRLMPNDAVEDRTYAYYSYHASSAEPQVSQRVDLWGPSTERPGYFKLITRMTSDGLPITSIFDRDGGLIRRVHGDGTVTEPSSVAQLRELWKSNGLQLGGSGR